MGKRFVAALSFGALACGLLFLACLGRTVPGDLLFNLAFGWIFYLGRVVPQVRVNGAGVATAGVCLAALAVGLQWFLRWFAGQMTKSAVATESTAPSWPVRRTAVVLGLIVLMFAAGIAVVGVGHQTAWLLNSPEPIIEGGIREPAARAQSQNNLKQMVLAMHNYQDAVPEKSLPPSALADRQGRPLLSWRVLILPYLEQETLYKKFHLDEPWDSPHNLRLLRQMPKVYASPSFYKTAKPYHTPYQVFVGKGTAFEGKSGLRLADDFPDGTSNTILIVEAAEAVPWTKPADLPYGRYRPLPALDWRSPHFFLAALADCSIRNVDLRQLKESTLRAAITRNGGEALGEDW